MEFTFDRVVAISGMVLGIVLVVLDKAGKLKGPVLFWLLGLAAVMTLPLALGNSWVSNLPWGILKFSRGMLMATIVMMCYSILAIWISPSPDHLQKVQQLATAQSSAPPGPTSTSLSSPVHPKQKQPSTPHIGSDNTLLNVPNLPQNMGDGNTIVGPTDSNGNTILNKGSVAIGREACADSTGTAIGAGANAGNCEKSTLPPKQ